MMLFNRFGKIRDVKIVPEQTRNKSYGFVTYFSEADARRAIQVRFGIFLLCYVPWFNLDWWVKAAGQHDNVMWGDRKLNVAPAVKKGHHNSPVSYSR